MLSHHASVPIDAPADRVWEIIADFGNVNVYNPNITGSHLTGDTARGQGATRHCDLVVPGASIEERIVAWEDGSEYRVEIFDGKKNPFKQAFATLAVRADGSQRSVASMTIEWRAKGGPLAPMLGRGLAGQNRKVVAAILAGLKHHVETGEAIAGRQRVDRSAVVSG